MRVHSCIFISAFRVVVCFSLTFRAVFLVWHSEPLFSLAFRAASLVWRSEPWFQFIIHSHHVTLSVQRLKPHFQFGVQSYCSFPVQPLESSCHIFSLAFRVVVCFQFRCSEPSSFLSYDIQSHHFQFDTQRCQFLVLTFRATISSLAFKATTSFQFGVQSHCSSSVRRSVPSSFLSFGVQSHQHFQFGVQNQHRSQFRRSEPSSFSVTMFRVVSFQFGVQSRLFPVWRSDLSSSLLSFDVQSRHHVHSLAFRATIFSQFGRSSPPSLFSLVFKVTISSQFRRSKPPSPYCLVFRVIIASQLRRLESSFLNLTFRYIGSQLWHSEPSSSLVWYSKPHLYLGVQSHHHHLSTVWYLEPVVHNLTFRATLLAFRVVFCSFSLAFRVFFFPFRALSS